MAILTSLFSGVTGLNAFGTALSVVGNNVANMNTVGFKDSSVNFSDIVSQSLNGASGGSQVGRGVLLSEVRAQFTQGSFETTDNGLDMAIEGDGFFMVRDNSGAQFFSRAGVFSPNQNGLVVNPEGFFLQGFLADATGNLTAQIGDINLASTTSPPSASTQVDFVANLDSRETIPSAFSVSSPASTSNFSTSVTVYDSLGNGHLITVYFRKSAEAVSGNTWQWFAVVNGSDNANSANAEVQANGTLTFRTDGALDTESAITYPTGGFDFSGGATQNQTIAFDFGTSVTTDSGTGLDGVTQFGSTSAVLNQTQNGFASGSLQSVSISREGIVTGLFTNGTTRVIAQLALARFNAPDGLDGVGNNLFAVSQSSGQPLIGTANSGGLGAVFANSLELSNVDLAEQFVKMIEFQRGFQANSRIITVTDELLIELVNLKR